MAEKNPQNPKSGVIMPTAEELVAIEEEGFQYQKRKGRIEMAVGLLFFVGGIGIIILDYQDASRSGGFLNLRIGAILFGFVTFLIGLSRQFRSKNR